MAWREDYQGGGAGTALTSPSLEIGAEAVCLAALDDLLAEASRFFTADPAIAWDAAERLGETAIDLTCIMDALAIAARPEPGPAVGL